MKSLIRDSILIVLLMAAAGAAVVIGTAPIPKDFALLRADYAPSERILLDRHGFVIQEQRQNKNVRRLSWVEIQNIPKTTLQLVLDAEDKRFHHHIGIDPLALASGLWSSVSGRHRRGASTISMQVADLIHSNDKTYRRRDAIAKLRQLHRALGLELFWSKSQILEAYLNLVYYRGELQGLGAAAHGLFSKAPFGLNAYESAVLAALIRAPNAKPELIEARGCRLLKNEPNSCLQVAAIVSNIKERYRIPALASLAPHIDRFLPKHLARVETSIDRDIQKEVVEILKREVLRLKEQNMNGAAAVVLDNASGEVVAYVGNIGLEPSAAQVDAAMAPRQAGSTLKPFFYSLALDKKLITAATQLLDVPLDVAVSNGLYRPSNFDRRFRDAVSVRTALASSLNIPAVTVLESVGVENAIQLMSDLGFTGLQRADFYGPSLALGSADVKLLELANAYRAIVNQGRWTPYRFTRNTSDPEEVQVLSEQATFVIADILSDRGGRGAAFGFANPLATRFWTAVKTGTSKDMRDNWCVGFSSKYTVAVWAGNLSGKPMWNVSGVQGAAPAWLQIMNHLHEREPSLPPSAPSEVTKMTVRYGTNGAPFSEWFITGTQPPEETIAIMDQGQSRLSYPVDQSLIALDSDIPQKRQRLFIAVTDPRPGQKLRLNGQVISDAINGWMWQPQLGDHRLELLSSDGRILDVARFQVRGVNR